MTAASGGPGDKPDNEGAQPSGGAYEAPPIEQSPVYPPPPVYGGYPPQGGFPPPPPPGYGYPPPPPPEGGWAPPPPGYPPTYAPPPEYGAPYPGGYGVPPTGNNPLAVFSLVASVIGLLCGVGSIIGIVLGVIALGQIKRSGQQGRGLAVAGIAVGAASLVISVLWISFAISS